MDGRIGGSKIGGNFRVFTVETNSTTSNAELIYNENEERIPIAGGVDTRLDFDVVNGAGILGQQSVANLFDPEPIITKRMAITRSGVSSEYVNPVVCISPDGTYAEDNTIVLDARFNPNHRFHFYYFNGIEWLTYDASEAVQNGASISNSPIICDLTNIPYEEPFYVKWTWYTDDGRNCGWLEQTYPMH